MKKLITVCAFVLLAGCTDTDRASLLAFGDESTVTCFGREVFQERSTGKVIQLNGDGITFKEKRGGHYIRAFADCIVISWEPTHDQD